MMCVTEEGGVSCGVCRQVISQLSPEATLIYTSVSQDKEIVTYKVLLSHHALFLA